jgi:hypothetical protein
MTATITALAAALRLAAAVFSVIPIRPDGSKAAACPGRHIKTGFLRNPRFERCSPATAAWPSSLATGSGNLEVPCREYECVRSKMFSGLRSS